MKKILYTAVFLIVITGGYFAGAHLSGGAWYSFGVPVGGDKGYLRQITTQFWEDIQFKDFDKAAMYHAVEKQNSVDIPYLIERLFMLKPEMLDIMSYEIQFVDIDTTNLRGRTKTNIHFKDLVQNRIHDQEVVLYFHRAQEADPWYMELETSLRNIAEDADKEKKH